MGISRIAVKGLTLIELLVTMAIATILTGVIVLMFKTSFDAYSYGQEEVFLQKALDDCLEEIADGGFESYGIKDALEILSATSTSITFVPLWVDDSQIIKLAHEHPDLATKTPFTLNRPFKAGTSLPICEVSTSHEPRGTKHELWKAVPITFVAGAHQNPLKPDDQVFLNKPVNSENKIRFIFHPEVKSFPDCALTISATGGSLPVRQAGAFGGKWQGIKIMRTYKGKAEIIPKHNIPGVTLSDFKIQYFDNTNMEVKPSPELIPNITAIKLSIEASSVANAKHEKLSKKDGFIFVNVRNTRALGTGLIMQPGMRIKIPDSKHIRVFSLSHVTNIKEGGAIVLEARPKKGTIWKIRIGLGFKEKAPMLKRYSVEYPPGRTVYAETISLSTDLPLNFLNLGANSRYDYDFDKGASNLVNLEGEVELVVTRMDASGAALFIRP